MPDLITTALEECVKQARIIHSKCVTAETECERLLDALEYLGKSIERLRRERPDQDYSSCRTFSQGAYKYLTENKISEAGAREIFSALVRGNLFRAKDPAGWTRFQQAFNPNTPEPIELIKGGPEDSWIVRIRPDKTIDNPTGG